MVSCESDISEATNVCQGGCITLGEELAQGEGYCYKWEAIGNGVDTDQTPDPLMDYLDENGDPSEQVRRACPTYPQYYRVVVTDGLNIVETEQYYLETDSRRNTIDNAPIFEVDIQASGVVCEDPPQSATLTIPISGDQMYEYEWSTGETGNSITVDELQGYTVTVTSTDGDRNGCQGEAAVIPPVCDADLAAAFTIDIPACALVDFKTEIRDSDNDDSDPDNCEGETVINFTNLTCNHPDPNQNSKLISALLQSARNALQTHDFQQNFILTSGCASDGGCDGQTFFEGKTPESGSMLVWLDLKPDGSAGMEIKFSDDFFHFEGLTAEQQNELKAAFIAGLKDLYTCDNNSLFDTLSDEYGADNQTPEECSGTSAGDCAACMQHCLDAEGLGSRGTGLLFGLRTNSTANTFNPFNLMTDFTGIWTSLKKLKINEEIWKHDGESIFYMYPAAAGLFEAILQDNPVVGVYELGKLLLNPKAWAIVLAASNPITSPAATGIIVEQATQIAGLVGQALQGFEDKLCARPPNDCDDMLFAWARLEGAIGMLVADFVVGGKGVDLLRRLVQRGIDDVAGGLGTWARRLGRLDEAVQENFWNRLGQVFPCPIALVNNPQEKSLSGCAALQAFQKHFDDLGEVHWNKVFQNPDMLNTWRFLFDNGRSADDIAILFKRFPDANADFYTTLQRFFDTDQFGRRFVKDPEAFQRFLTALEDPQLRNVLLRADGTGLEAWNYFEQAGKTAWQADSQLLSNLADDLASNSRGDDIRRLLNENPSEIDIWREIRDNPQNASEIAKESPNSEAWGDWGDTRYFLDNVKKGRDFEAKVYNELRDPNSQTYQKIEAELGINLEDFDIGQQVQFIYSRNPEKYFVADVVLINKNTGDIIILETKLSEGTSLSTNQSEGLNALLNGEVLEVRSQTIDGLPQLGNGDQIGSGNGYNISMYKVYSEGNGNSVTGVNELP